MARALADHDRAAGVLDPAAGLAAALARLQLDGAIFLRGVYSEAWAYESVPAADAAAVLAPGSPRVILFHVIAQGRAWIETDHSPRTYVVPGDVIVLPYGERHRMGGEAEAVCASMASLVPMPPWTEMPVVRHGGGGERTEVVCGYLTCDDPLFDPGLRALPELFVVHPSGPARSWVLASIDYALQQTSMSTDRLDGPVQIPQSLLIEVLKLHLASAPAAETGWLGAMHDPVLGPALAAIHAVPEQKWSVDSLARAAHASGTVLDERFRTALGMAPIRYLTGWRMHVAGTLLKGSDLPVVGVARRVGYDSEEAFSRAFKRHHGAAPSVWRVRR
jgi:AraC-like DNA-binding protein